MRAAWCLSLLALTTWLNAEPIQVRMMGGAAMGIPAKEATDPRSIARRAVFEAFHKLNPDIRVVNAGGLEMTGERAESMFLMAMAGARPPDVFYVNFRQYYNYIDQGFCMPLDDLIKADPAVIGRVNPVVKGVLTSFDGQWYAVPFFQVAMGLYYRRDHFREAGLDPTRPPKTWDELYEFSKKIAASKPGRAGFAFSKGAGYHWSNFVFQAGGQVVKINPDGSSEAAVDSPEAAKALEFFRKMTVEKWRSPSGEWQGPAGMVTPQFRPDIRDGKCSMWLDYSGDVVTSMGGGDLDPSIVGIAAMPEGPASASHEVNAGCWAINARVKDPKKLEACWKFIKFFAGEEAARVNTQVFVEQGMASFVNPKLLKQFGYEDLIGSVDPSYVAANEEIFKGGHPEPYGKNTSQVYAVLDNALDRAMLEPGTDERTILRDCAREMNEKLLGYTPPETMARQRFAANLIAGVMILSGLVFTIWWVRRRDRKPQLIPLTNRVKRSRAFIAFCLAPATFTLALWAYYPLARGLFIAFQDYKILEGPRWVGLDNFIAVFTQPIFYKALSNSFTYVGLSIGIGFFIPIFLAVALNEIMWGRVFFRTLFFLPAMTSGIVIALLWRQFYDKSETGYLNQLIRPIVQMVNDVLIHDPASKWPLTYDWLGTPHLAMLSVVLPGVWAAAGPGSILYLAALKNIPDEHYEAADLDGAHWWHKIRHITMPGLKPLMLINLLGLFIGGFKAMESVFVLTLGGPLYATHTMGLEVWTNAFMFLKFGYATAAAWIMGGILVAFTIIQIRSLLKMRFTTART